MHTMNSFMSAKNTVRPHADVESHQSLYAMTMSPHLVFLTRLRDTRAIKQDLRSILSVNIRIRIWIVIHR